MDKVIEEKFIKTFICKRAQNRILSVLEDKNKRKMLRAGLSKVMDYINSDFVYLRDNSLGIIEAENEIKKFSQDLKYCYVIAGAYDGEFLPFKNALYLCFSDNLASIIIVNETLAFVKTEVRYNQAMKYILYKKT